MAKKEKEKEVEVVESDGKDLDSVKLGKLLIKEFNKNAEKSGKIAWNLATDDDNPTDVKEFISTGSTLLDYIIANRENGGVPVGKLTEISGEEASGKSLICAHLIAETQKRGGIAIYIDTENSANPEFMTRVGVNIKELVYLQPETVEDVGAAIEKAIIMARTRAPNKLVLVIWDSIAGTPTLAELEGDFQISMDVQLAKARLLAKQTRKITQMIGKERVALVYTNQLKVKIGVMYGDPMTTPGGKGVPYHSSVRIRLEAGQKQKNDKTEEIYGVHTRAKIVKNRLGPPWRKAEFDILFASGVDNESSWVERLHAAGEIMRKDAWMYLTSFPSGKIQDKGVHEGQDLGLAFQEKDWKKLLEREDVRKHVLGLLKKHMIVRYGEKPADMVLDPESLMDAESVKEILSNE